MSKYWDSDILSFKRNIEDFEIWVSKVFPPNSDLDQIEDVIKAYYGNWNSDDSTIFIVEKVLYDIRQKRETYDRSKPNYWYPHENIPNPERNGINALFNIISNRIVYERALNGSINQILEAYEWGLFHPATIITIFNKLKIIKFIELLPDLLKNGIIHPKDLQAVVDHLSRGEIWIEDLSIISDFVRKYNLYVYVKIGPFMGIKTDEMKFRTQRTNNEKTLIRLNSYINKADIFNDIDDILNISSDLQIIKLIHNYAIKGEAISDIGELSKTEMLKLHDYFSTRVKITSTEVKEKLLSTYKKIFFEYMDNELKLENNIVEKIEEVNKIKSILENRDKYVNNIIIYLTQ